MLSLRPRLALFLLFLTVSTLGLPINNGKTPKSLEEIKPKKLVDQSTISSKCNKIGMWPWYNRYEITATKWPLSEEEVKKAVKSAGLMTGWMYRPWGTDLTVIQVSIVVLVLRRSAFGQGC